MNTTTEYIPGICNINPKEVKRRRTIGIIGLLMVVAIATLLIFLNVPAGFRLVIFIPAFIMATGFLQAKAKFCVGFASAGMQHTGDESRNVEDKEALKLDKKRAKKINIQALIIAVIVTGVIVLLPI
jgi:predicted nucleic acid-binding Zn ribbon protein